MTLLAPPRDTVATGGGSEQDAVLRLADVMKVYPGSPPVVALDGIDLTVQRGELAAIVGPSGSGKSTLLHVIGTLDRPSSGRVIIDGHDVSGMSDKGLSAVRSRLIGFVFQQFFLLNGMSAVENVATGLLYTGASPADRHAAATTALERVGLGHRLDHRPNELSGGERQRVAIARALVHRPSIVLADEPTGNLDSRSGEAIMALLRELHAEGSTILIITHDRDLAAALPRRISFLDGRIESDVLAGPSVAVDGNGHRDGDGHR
ncbi:MAG: ABC transporter ATP-binding protein [Acidimicrobiales bacterium]